MQPSVLSHARAPLVYAVGVVIAAALLSLVPRVGSRAMSTGAGLAAGGAVATVVCGIAWRDGVPNPLTRGEVAFNIADVAIGTGVVLLVGGALLHAWHHRAHLREPV